MSLCLNEETLQAYFDGELAPDAAATVITHLAGCAACADYARQVETALILIENAFDDELPENVPTASLRARTEEEIGRKGLIGLIRLISPISPIRPVGLAVAIVVVAIILAGGVASRLWQSTLSEPKENMVKQGGASAPRETSSDQLQAEERRPADSDEPEKPKRKELKGARRADLIAHRVKPGRTPPEPTLPEVARMDPVERVDPPSISTIRRAKTVGNVTLRNPETSEHLMQAQLLLRSFRNAPIEEGAASFNLAYEKRLSRELLSKNRLLRRSAENKEDSQAEELLSHIEPLLLDIAHLPDKPSQDEVRSVRELIREQNIIATLQIYSAKAGY